MNRELIQNILLAVFALVLVLMGWMLYSQNRTILEFNDRLNGFSQSMMESSMKMDDAMMRIEVMGDGTEEGASSSITNLDERVRMSIKCLEIGDDWKPFYSDVFKLSFCVKDSWSVEEKVIMSSAGEGRFVNLGTIGSIAYTSQDYHPPASGAYRVVNWDAYNVTSSIDEIRNQVTTFSSLEEEGESLEVSKFDLNGRTGFLEERREFSPFENPENRDIYHTYSWYIPKVSILREASDASALYNIAINASSEGFTDAERVVNSLVIHE